MTQNDSSSCSGVDKERADRYLISLFNWGYNLGLGIPNDPNELGRIQQEQTKINPACLQYIESVSARLQGMNQAGKIREQIDKIPF